MLKTRLVSTFVMLAIFFASFFIFDPWLFFALTSIVSIIALYELCSLFRLKFNQKIILWSASLVPSIYFYLFNFCILF